MRGFHNGIDFCILRCGGIAILFISGFSLLVFVSALRIKFALFGCVVCEAFLSLCYCFGVAGGGVVLGCRGDGKRSQWEKARAADGHEQQL